MPLHCSYNCSRGCSGVAFAVTVRSNSAPVNVLVNAITLLFALIAGHTEDTIQ